VAASKDGELVTMSSSQPSTPAEHKRRTHPTLEQLETLPTTEAGRTGLTANGLTKLVIPPPPAPPPEDEDHLHPVELPNGVEENGDSKEAVAAVAAVMASSHSSGLSDEDEAARILVNETETSGMTLPE